MAPAKVPKSASGRNPASEASESMLAEPVVSVMCQTKPICSTELVSTDTELAAPHARELELPGVLAVCHLSALQ